MELSLFDGGKKRNKMPKDAPELPAGIGEEELKYYYRNPNGSAIFTPIYEVYNEIYMNSMVHGLKIQTNYAAFKDTSWMERYTSNLYQFSAAKTVSTGRAMQREVYDDKGQLRSWPQFRNKADAIQETANKVHLRVERDNCARQAIMADKFTDMRADKDYYPYWMYVGRMDSRERPEHKALEGLIFRIGDKDGDAMFPPSDWNCRCTGKPIDDKYLRDRRRVVQTNNEARSWLHGVDEDGKPFVDPQFRYNPADQGMMPRVGDYFIEMPTANAGNANLFGINGPHKPDLHAAILENLPEIIRGWKLNHHVDRLGNIVFQNKALLTNVWFTHRSATKIHAHPRGSGYLPETIEDPAEIWMRWEDPLDQQVVLRNYITFLSNAAYIVQTRDGAIQDAFLLSKGQAEKHRIGVPWIK